jgi:hypothetical protein
VEDLFQPGKMEPVVRGSDIAATCFSVSAVVVAVKERQFARQGPGVDLGLTVLLVNQYVCVPSSPRWEW